MSSSKVRKKEDVSTMLVFDDIVVLGQMEKGVALYGKRRDKRLRVIEGGVGRVLEVKNLTGWGGTFNCILGVAKKIDLHHRP